MTQLHKEAYIGEHCTGYTYQLDGSGVWRAEITFSGHRKPVYYGTTSKQKLLDALTIFDFEHGKKLAGMKEARDQRDIRKKVLRSQAQAAITVGTLLHGSWGYDQTNCELFQVTAVSGFTVQARKIASRQETCGAGMEANFFPLRDKFIGEPIKLRISAGGCKYNDLCRLVPSDWSRSYYCSWYG